MTHEQIEQYLSRIGIDHAERPSADFLARLHYAHLQNVPYENLDILAGIPLSLAVPDLFDKIVLRRRGGFCFELNRLFGELLRDLGFVVTDYVARYWGGGDGTVPKRRHHVSPCAARRNVRRRIPLRCRRRRAHSALPGAL